MNQSQERPEFLAKRRTRRIIEAALVCVAVFIFLLGTLPAVNYLMYDYGMLAGALFFGSTCTLFGVTLHKLWAEIFDRR